MHDTLLSAPTQQLITLFAYTFQGYDYALQHLQKFDTVESVSSHDNPAQLRLDRLYKHVQHTGRIPVRISESFAVNYYLHRNINHQGYPPAAYTPSWYDMVFYYLHLYRTEVPIHFRNSGEYAKWNTRPKGAAENAAAEIRLLLSRSNNR